MWRFRSLKVFSRLPVLASLRLLKAMLNCRTTRLWVVNIDNRNMGRPENVHVSLDTEEVRYQVAQPASRSDHANALRFWLTCCGPLGGRDPRRCRGLRQGTAVWYAHSATDATFCTLDVVCHKQGEDPIIHTSFVCRIFDLGTVWFLPQATQNYLPHA